MVRVCCLPQQCTGHCLSWLVAAARGLPSLGRASGDAVQCTAVYADAHKGKQGCMAPQVQSIAFESMHELQDIMPLTLCVPRLCLPGHTAARIGRLP